MKILQLTAENVKKLVAVEITPAGNVVQITGANGSGKSSVLDAIFWALAGTSGVDDVPVRTGAQKARIRLDLGDLIVTRRFIAESGGTSLVVEKADGARYPSPQSMLDAMLGALSFDPLAFSRMDTKTQMNTVRAIVPLDVDLNALDQEISYHEERRRSAAREEKEAAAARRTMIVDDEIAIEPVDVRALVADHRAALDREASRASAVRERASLLEGMATAKERAEELRRNADHLDTVAREYAQKAEMIERALATIIEGVDARTSDEILAEISGAEAINANAKIASDREAMRLAELTARREFEEEEETIATLRADKAAAIARAPMPIEGLSFGDHGLIYNGVPLSQASSAEQLRVSIAIAMKLNPTLRVLRIKDGSLLDETSLALVSSMADAEDYQVWIERVDTSGKIGIVLSDGHVVEADPSDAGRGDR